MTSEQEKLLQKAERSLEAATILNQRGLFEFATARAYYTMFYAAQALLIGEGLSFSTHSGVMAAFGQQFVRTGRIPKEFHRALIAAERARLQGDYDIELSLSEVDTAEQITQAEQFLEMAQREISSS